MEWTLEAIAKHLKGRLIGDGATVIRNVNNLDTAKAGELTFAENPRRLAQAMASQASAIIVSDDVRELGGRTGIGVANPKLAFAQVLALFYPSAAPAGGVHASAVLGERVHLGEDVSIGAHAVLGDDVSIGRGTTVRSGVHVGEGVSIGEDCEVDPNVVIYRQTHIGDRVQIHGGSVIGGDGFGYVYHEGHHVKVPQVGNVIIEDDVEIGCNVCVDRATIGSTLIKRGAKIDNLVQIAHNNRIGQHVILAGQVGLSGSVTIGNYAVMAGQVGVADHVTVGEGAQIGGGSVVIKSVEPGQRVWGFPARPIHDTTAQMASLGRLPSVLKRLLQLITRMPQMEARLHHLEQQTPLSAGGRPAA